MLRKLEILVVFRKGGVGEGGSPFAENLASKIIFFNPSLIDMKKKFSIRGK